MRYVVSCALALIIGCGSSVTSIPDGSTENPDGSDDATADAASDADDAASDAREDAMEDEDAGCTAPPSGATSDGCCASGATANNDVDCAPVCGNGALEATELCDTGIIGGAPGACPSGCTSNGACDVVTHVAAACQSRCDHSTKLPSGQTADGCCPPGAGSADVDCAAPACGNGVREGDELCDIAAIGPDACPLSCPPRTACEAGSLAGTACATYCAYASITAPSGATIDDCCPGGATANTDVDCTPACGNGIREVGEACDTAIVTGAPDACPTTCTPAGACDATVLSGSGCATTCTHTPITASNPTTMDGCCPSGSNANLDADCAPICGNGLVEPGEVCDRAASTTDAKCENACQTFTCRGLHFDVDGNTANGCEVHDTGQGGPTKETATNLGTRSCSNSNPFTITGMIPSDGRVHADPAVVGFSTYNGATQDWYSMYASGGACINDFLATLTIQGGNGCYYLHFFNGREGSDIHCLTNASGTCTIDFELPLATYDSGTTVYFRVARVCSSMERHGSGVYTITGHL